MDFSLPLGSYYTFALQESSSGKTKLSDLLMGRAHLTQDIKLPVGNWDEMKGETAHETLRIGLGKTIEEIQPYCHGYLFCHGLYRCCL